MKELTDEQLLNKYGWTVECESPFEISTEDGSFASMEAAYIVLGDLRGRIEEETSESKLDLCDVSQAKRLLLAFCESVRYETMTPEMFEFYIEQFLKANNCG